MLRIKTNKFEFNVSTWLLLFVLLVADNMYGNHCKGKLVKGMVEKGD